LTTNMINIHMSSSIERTVEPHTLTGMRTRFKS
jgi:hypothetical protein